MIHHVVFVAGSPGSGKTTAIRMLALPSVSKVEDSEIQLTLTPPYAFVGHYRGSGTEDTSDQGGDRVARHANLLCLEYWKRNILPDSRYRVTILDSEIFMTETVFKYLADGTLNFINFQDLNKDGTEKRKEYHEGGLRFKTWQQILRGDKTRFPDSLDGNPPRPQTKFSCVYLSASREVAEERRKNREVTSDKQKKSVFSEQRWKSLVSRQLNWADKFKASNSPQPSSGDQDVFSFFGGEKTSAPSVPEGLSYHAIDVDKMAPGMVSAEIDRIARRFMA